jgi:hypothetical protein
MMFRYIHAEEYDLGFSGKRIDRSQLFKLTSPDGAVLHCGLVIGGTYILQCLPQRCFGWLLEL